MACKEISLSIDQSTGVEDEDDLSFTLVEEMAVFTGDKDGVEAYILKNMIYPPDALAEGLEGYVYVEFLVEPDGSIIEVRVIGSSDKIFEQEALRLVNLTNKKWKAALQSGKKVKSRMILEVAFSLKG